MNLLHITATHLRPDGGIPIVLKNLVEEQNKFDNFKSRVLSISSSVNKINSSYFDYIKVSQFEKYIKNYKPNIVVLHSFYYLKYNLIVNLLIKYNIPYFIEPHGSFGKEALKKSRIKKFLANTFIFRKQIKKAFGFIFLNEEEEKDSYYRTSNDLIIPNGIYKLNMKKYIIPKKLNNFYFIGRYDINHKGLDYLLDALEILEKEKYILSIHFWGKGDKKSENYIKNRIKNFEYINVEFNSSIYGKEKDMLLEQFGPMLLTSRYEGFPMTILEAWYYGNPCLVTVGTNVYKEVIENKLGWGTNLNSLDIALSIKNAAKEYNSNRENYIYRCKNYVLKNYLWENIAKNSILKFKNIDYLNKQK